MDYYIQIFLSLCVGLFLIGAWLWVMYFAAAVIMWAFPFVAPVALGSLAVLAIIAWRRSSGH